MWPPLRRLVEHLFPNPTPPRPAGASERSRPDARTRELQLATAVLLAEVMRAENREVPPASRAAVEQALRDRFALDAEAAAALAARAEQVSRKATDLYTYTSLLDARLGIPAKLQLVERLWRVAYADGRLGDHERHLMWRIADLLHVPQGAYVHARLRAERAAGLEPPSSAAG